MYVQISDLLLLYYTYFGRFSCFYSPFSMKDHHWDFDFKTISFKRKLLRWMYNLYIDRWEPEGRYPYSKMFRREPEGRYHHRVCPAIAPFWFSTEHLWILIYSALLALNWRYTRYHTTLKGQRRVESFLCEFQ